MWSRTEGSAATTTLRDFEGLKSYYRVSTIVPGSDGGVKSVPGRRGSVINGLHAQENTGAEQAVQRA